MSRPGALNTLMFWLLLLLGTAALAPCLILPAWLERQAQAECLRAHQERIALLERRLLTTQKQIEHLNKDPAYALRLAERDFGDSLTVPGARTVRVDPAPIPDGPQGDAVPSADAGEALDGLPELAGFLERALRRYPETRLFVHHRTRPIIMATGGGLILAAIVLVAFGRWGAAGIGAQADPRE